MTPASRLPIEENDVVLDLLSLIHILAVGYGEQETNGFSVRVLGLYEKGDGVVFETNLLAPEKGQEVSQKKSMPYLVVKMKKLEKKIEFWSEFFQLKGCLFVKIKV